MSTSYYDTYWQHRLQEQKTEDPRTPKRVALFSRHLSAQASVLDVGCGAGNAASRLAALGYRVSGIDIADEVIDFARTRYPEIHFSRFEAGGPFPAADTSYDAVYCGDVIEHVYDTRMFLSEIARVLRPNGVAMISTPYHGIAKNLALILFGFERHFDPAGPHIRFFTARGLRRMARDVRLEPVRDYLIGRFRPLSENYVLIAHRVSD